MTMVVTGAGMLWFGWFGFNGGSAFKVDGSAGMAIAVTHLAAAAGSLTWMTIEWLRFGKPSVLGIVTGMVAGLGTITPASGYVGPVGGLIIGMMAGGGVFLGYSIDETGVENRRLLGCISGAWRRRGHGFDPDRCVCR